MSRLAVRDVPSPYRHDREGKLRVIASVDTFPDVTDAAFNQIRQYGRSSAAVTIRLLEAIASVGRFAHRPADRAALLRHVEMIARSAQDGLPARWRRACVATGSSGGGILGVVGIADLCLKANRSHPKHNEEP